MAVIRPLSTSILVDHSQRDSNLSYPDLVVVRITEQFVYGCDNPFADGINSGYYIGVVYLPDAEPMPRYEQSIFRENSLINPKHVYGVACLDNWLLNDDRKDPRNNLVELLPDRRIKYIPVDFSFCFADDNWKGEDVGNIRDSPVLMGFPISFLYT
jgi:hypothetical protein